MSSSSSSSPCAACKLLRRKCTPECIFAPYFPPEQPEKFASVHRVFGASNVGKLLKEIVPQRREEAVASLAYEAAARLQDPVHGCVGHICLLQRHLGEIQRSLAEAKKELAVFLGPAAFAPSSFLPHHHLQQQQQHHHHHPHHLQHHHLPPAVVPFAEMPNAAAAGGFVQHHHHAFDDRMVAGGDAGPPQLVAFPGSEQIEFPYGIEQFRVREGVN